jgi:hypothetical protein
MSNEKRKLSRAVKFMLKQSNELTEESERSAWMN